MGICQAGPKNRPMSGCMKAMRKRPPEMPMATGWSGRNPSFSRETAASNSSSCRVIEATCPGGRSAIIARAASSTSAPAGNKSASATLKIITLRTYSLIVVRSRVLEPKTMERDLSPSPGKLDTWDLLAQANGAILQARTPEQVVLQLGESAPFPMKKIEWVACRSTILAGCVAGTLPAASEGGTGDDGPSPVSLYLL